MTPRFYQADAEVGGGKRPLVILYANEPAAEIGQSILEGAAEFMMQPFDLELLQFKLHQAGVL